MTSPLTVDIEAISTALDLRIDPDDLAAVVENFRLLLRQSQGLMALSLDDVIESAMIFRP